MKTKISVRQICFIMLAYTVASRLLLYPTQLAGFSGRDLLFSALIDFAIQGAVIWSVSYLCSRTDKTFFGLLQSNIGTVGARVVMGFFAAFFILCAIVPLFEQKLYVHAIFYDTVPSLAVFLPFFFFAVYAGSRGFENIGRCADICLPLLIISLAAIFGMSLGEVQPSALLPVLKTPVGGVFGGALRTAYRFAEPGYLLMFMGRFRYKKGDAAKITLSYAGGALIVLFFLFIFYGIYGGITLSRQFAVSKTSLFFPATDAIGRIDLIALYILEIVMLFALVLNIQLAVQCLAACTGYENTGILSLAVNVALAAIVIACNHYFFGILQVFSDWMWIVFILFATVIPLSVWALGRRA